MREFRVISSGTELRADPGGKNISGYAAVFDSPSEDLGGFTETVRRGAFARAIRERHDVRALFNHNPSMILGRVSAGTLALNEDSRGLFFRCTMPSTSYAADLAESIRRGDISQCSFGFVAQGETWDRARTARTLTDLDLLDVSPVTYPAYSDTSVVGRSLKIFDAQATLRYYPGPGRGTRKGMPAARVSDEERTRMMLQLAKAKLSLR